MVKPTQMILADQVAEHYNELDHLYREIWGPHLHHGWFETGKESIPDATNRLCDEIAHLLRLQSSQRICDVGCGYGETSRYLARNYQAHVTGLTISTKQYEYARAQENPETVQFINGDWLQNQLPDNSFNHVLSIESSEHMPNKEAFFSEAARVLKPKGNFVICAWLAKEFPRSWERKYLLEPICREGRMPALESAPEYRQHFRNHGFRVDSYQDISHLVKKTWTLSLQKLALHFFKNPRELRWILPQFNTNADFLKSLFRIRIAYDTGAMKYGIFKATKL